MIYAMLITVCTTMAAPDEPQCETFPIPVAGMTLQQCMLFGEQTALEWMRQHSYFEFHHLIRWTCDTGERT